MSNVRTASLKKHLTLMKEANTRLTARDKAFLKDLAKVRIVGVKDATQAHFGGKGDSCQRRLKKLAEVGLLKETTVIQPGQKAEKCYEFASDRIARRYGGRASGIGAKRTALHELLVSKSYFAIGKPADFKLGSEMSELEKASMLTPVPGKTDGITPDAYFYRDGELIFVEADAGQYTKKQVRDKQRSWGKTAQVWVQPSKRNCKVPDETHVNVMRF